MLAAWARIKYPNLFHGAIASSAPLLYFSGVPDRPQGGYYDVLTSALERNGCDIGAILASQSAIKTLTNDGNFFENFI